MTIGPALKYLSGAVALAALFALSLAAARAAPAGAWAADLSTQARAGAAVDKAAYRCRWRNGERRCRWVPDDEYHGYEPEFYYYGPGSRYYSGPLRPEAYPTGSREWWQAMEQWGRAGAGRR